MQYLHQEDGQFIFNTDGEVCSSKRELLSSDVLPRIMDGYTRALLRRESPTLEILRAALPDPQRWDFLLSLLKGLSESPLEKVAEVVPDARPFLGEGPRAALHEFVEGLYDFWRSFDRFMVLTAQPGPSSFDQRPYRSFNATVEALTHLVRSSYRDICENITGNHPRIYRQVAAGCDVGFIALPVRADLPMPYRAAIEGMPFVRQVWIDPPMIIDPPMNTRTGQFQKVEENPVDPGLIRPGEWLCYPARVGPLVILVCFHRRFMGLGSALANLFELATDEQLAARPDALYFFGAPPEMLSRFGALPTVFYDDEAHGLLVAAVPAEDRFGYFGYLKKMTLTMHNIAMIKRGRMPFHGAMVNIQLKGGAAATLLVIGDTAAGKSETLEAFRVIGRDRIRQMRIIADDMGSLSIEPDGSVLGYGTEIGAFIRLDDLQQGYAFGQIDRAIIMSPQKVNARVVLPVTTIEEVLRGYPVDCLLYANNYEEVDASHPVLERHLSSGQALAVFAEGAAMAKGTTTSQGMVRSYFANIFGPSQYRDAHDALAAKTFDAAFGCGTWVGQLRTQLGIPGREKTGPEQSARALIEWMEKRAR